MNPKQTCSDLLRLGVRLNLPDGRRGLLSLWFKRKQHFSVPLLHRHGTQATKNTIFGVLSVKVLINAFQKRSLCGGGQAEQSEALLWASLQMHIRPAFQTFVSPQYQAKPKSAPKNKKHLIKRCGNERNVSSLSII